MEKIGTSTILTNEELLRIADQLDHERIQQGIKPKLYGIVKYMIRHELDQKLIDEMLEVAKLYIELVRKGMRH